jgi:hypothetical protein
VQVQATSLEQRAIFLLDVTTLNRHSSNSSKPDHNKHLLTKLPSFTMNLLHFIHLHVFRAWWFDPFIASVSFTGFINLYWWHELKHGVIEWKKVGTGSKDDLKVAAWYWIGIFLWKIFVSPPPNIWDGFPTSLWDVLYLSAEVCSGIILYDAIFFFIHWSMHEIPALRWIHLKHHQTEPTVKAWHLLRHSMPDAALQVLVNILAQRTTPWGVTKSRLARAIHNIVVIWMLTESHTASPTPYIWRRWFVGVREHAQHHHTGKLLNDHRHLRYQQFFGYLDDLRLGFSLLTKLTKDQQLH